MERRIITTELMEEDQKNDSHLRPQYLDDYIGQEKIKSTSEDLHRRSQIQGREPGSCAVLRTSRSWENHALQALLPMRWGSHMKITSGPAIEKPGEMAAILNNLQEGDVLFVDEIHRLNRQVEEVLYPAMEDFAIDIMLGKDSAARSIRLDLPKFTLVGATTRVGLLTAPLRDRFGVVQQLEFLYATGTEQ